MRHWAGLWITLVYIFARMTTNSRLSLHRFCASLASFCIDLGCACIDLAENSRASADAVRTAGFCRAGNFMEWVMYQFCDTKKILPLWGHHDSVLLYNVPCFARHMHCCAMLTPCPAGLGLCWAGAGLWKRILWVG